MNLLTLGAGILALFSTTGGQAPSRPHTDQTVNVTRGARLLVNAFAGEVKVHAWERDAIRVQADHSVRDTIDIKTTESLVTIRPQSSMGAPRSIDLDITMPSWMRLDVSGTYIDVIAEGLQGEVAIETVRGDVTVKGGSGFISLKSVEGAVSLESAKGRINVRSVNEGIQLTDIAGEVVAETVNGGIALARIQSTSVDIATVNGDLSYEGTIRDDGQYRLTTHNGDITMSIPENANATIAVRTFNGEFVAAFPVKIEETSRRNKRFNLTIGSGSARVDLESFGGTIRLQRPGAAKPPRHER